MYDIIYSYLSEHIFNSEALEAYSTSIMGVNTNLNVWLTHTACIALMVVAVVLACLLVRWVWRSVSGAFLLR